MSNGHSKSTGKINGVMVGIVTNNDDPEGLGRVKLKLPIQEMESETEWARIATFYAGKDRGSYFIPEVGDEVLVTFHLGELRQPYVIGMLWNRDNGPSVEDVNIRKITSRAGHEIIFDDRASDGKVTIRTQSGQVIEMDDQNDEIKISDKEGENIMTVSGTSTAITLKSGSSSIKLSSGTVKITAPSGITLEGGNVKISGNKVDVSSSGMLDLKASGTSSLKGSMVKIN